MSINPPTPGITQSTAQRIAFRGNGDGSEPSPVTQGVKIVAGGAIGAGVGWLGAAAIKEAKGKNTTLAEEITKRVKDAATLTGDSLKNLTDKVKNLFTTAEGKEELKDAAQQVGKSAHEKLQKAHETLTNAFKKGSELAGDALTKAKEEAQGLAKNAAKLLENGTKGKSPYVWGGAAIGAALTALGLYFMGGKKQAQE